ncbi:MAG: hypothetical protein P8181_05215 [bacterium]
MEPDKGFEFADIFRDAVRDEGRVQIGLFLWTVAGEGPIEHPKKLRRTDDNRLGQRQILAARILRTE